MLADLCEEYSDGIAHITTRQDIQLHFIHIEDTPALMWRLASVGITTREACGNSVRNVTACPIAGVCREQTFDVTPYAKAITYFMLGHPDAQSFGRKFKIAFSGCKENACALVRSARFRRHRRHAGSRTARRGADSSCGWAAAWVRCRSRPDYTTNSFRKKRSCRIAQAIARVFARLGEKKNRNTARLKFLVSKLGIEEFKKLVAAEREILPYDSRWTDYLKDVPHYCGGTAQAAVAAPDRRTARPEGFEQWYATNVYRQRQQGYATVTIALPLGDITATQLRVVADVSRKYLKETIRSTVEQNLVLRWVSESDLPSLYTELKRADLATPVAGTIVDVSSCPGTDTCKLGIASSRGLAGELRMRLAHEKRGARRSHRQSAHQDQRLLQFLRPAPCRRSGLLRRQPQQERLHGSAFSGSAGRRMVATTRAPTVSRSAPCLPNEFRKRWIASRAAIARSACTGETFQAFIKRIGKAECKKMIDEFTAVPPHEEDASFYSDWGDPREFSLGDIGVGECAGEVVFPIDFELVACEREVVRSAVAARSGNIDKAAQHGV